MSISEIVAGITALRSIGIEFTGRRKRLFEEKIDPSLSQMKDIHDDFLNIISEARDVLLEDVDAEQLPSLVRRSRLSGQAVRRLLYEEARIEARNSHKYVVVPLLQYISEEDVEYIKGFYQACYEYFHTGGAYYHEIENLLNYIDAAYNSNANLQVNTTTLLSICDECASSLNNKWADIAKAYATVKARLV